MDTSAKYVVISTKKFPGGSRVGCMATTKEKAEATKTSLETNERTKDYGPFQVISYQEAERRKMYGD